MLLSNMYDVLQVAVKMEIKVHTVSSQFHESDLT